MELVLTSIDSMSHEDIRKSNIDSKNIHTFDIK